MTIPVTGQHTWITKVNQAATCGEEGRKFEQCTVCGAQKTAEIIPATGKHKYESYKATKAAAVLEEGSKTRTCSVCGTKTAKVIAKLKATTKVNVKTVTLKVKQSTIAVKVIYGKGDKIVSWKSSNKKVATVTSKGKITAKKKGAGYVKVTSGKKTVS